MRRLFIAPDGRLNLFWRLFTYTLLYFVMLMLAQALQERALGLPRNSLRGTLVHSGLAVALTIGLTWFYRTKVDKRPWSGVGLTLRGRVGQLLTGFAAGVLLIGLVFAIEYAAGWLTITGFEPNRSGWGTALSFVVAGLLYAITPGFTEEVLMRGYWFQNLGEGRRLWVSTLVVAVAFALLHFGQFGPWMLVFIPSMLVLSTGLILSRLVTGSLWMAIGWHTAWDFAQWAVFGISPLWSMRPLIAVQMTGPIWLIGPPGMPEEGLVGILVEMLGVGLLLAYMAWRRYRIDWKATLAPDGRVKASEAARQAVHTLSGRL